MLRNLVCLSDRRRDGKLAGIVSIGDVVKHRLEDLESETNVLRDAYMATQCPGVARSPSQGPILGLRSSGDSAHCLKCSLLA